MSFGDWAESLVWTKAETSVPETQLDAPVVPN